MEVATEEESIGSAVDRFLEFLAQDMSKHPAKSVVTFPRALLDRAVALTAGMTVDLDSGIEEETDPTLEPE